MTDLEFEMGDKLIVVERVSFSVLGLGCTHVPSTIFSAVYGWCEEVESVLA